MQDFRRLKVWRKSHHLILEVYAATMKFPKEKLYGLMGQIRRAASLLTRKLKLLPSSEHDRLPGETNEVKRTLMAFTQNLRTASVPDLKTNT